MYIVLFTYTCHGMRFPHVLYCLAGCAAVCQRVPVSGASVLPTFYSMFCLAELRRRNACAVRAERPRFRGC